MPDWAVHIIVPLFALLLVTRKENVKYVLYLLPLALILDLDHFALMHRALFHNIFIPLVFFGVSMACKNPRTRFILLTGAVYTGSHVILDLFDGGVGLFYPLSSSMFFITAELLYQQDFSWVLDWGVVPCSGGWTAARGYVIDSAGSGALILLMLAGACIYYRKKTDNNRSEEFTE